MRTDHPREDPLVELGYEVRDVNYGALTKAVVIFFVFFGFSILVALWTYNVMYTDRSTTARNMSVQRRLPGGANPLLQNNVVSKTDIAEMRRHEAAVLHGTGRIEGSDRVHIPIDRAMDLLAERGLPRTNADVPAISRGNDTDQVRQTEPGTNSSPTPPMPRPSGTSNGAGH